MPNMNENEKQLLLNCQAAVTAYDKAHAHETDQREGVYISGEEKPFQDLATTAFNLITSQGKENTCPEVLELARKVKERGDEGWNFAHTLCFAFRQAVGDLRLSDNPAAPSSGNIFKNLDLT